jgi:hypothetical protein
MLDWIAAKDAEYESSEGMEDRVSLDGLAAETAAEGLGDWVAGSLRMVAKVRGSPASDKVGV